MIHRVVDQNLPLELMGSTANSTEVSEINIFLTTSATAGNRTPQLELRASTKQICAMANWTKTAYTALKNKLNADEGVKDTDYAADATAAATTLATAYALLNAIKAAINTLEEKLDDDEGVALTVYAAQCAIGSADATTPATAITLANEIRTDLRRLCNLLDGETTVADEDYEAVVMAGVPAALTVSSTKNASAATVASKTGTKHCFSTAVSDGSGTGYVNTAITKYTIPVGACLAVNMSTVVDATGDNVTIDVMFV
jgi:hypothetical protein